MKYIKLLVLLTPVYQVVAISGHEPTVAASQFKEPPIQYRPKFRYWYVSQAFLLVFVDSGRLPDASVPPSSVQDDVRQIAAVGAGGLEFLPYYSYGLGPAVTDWSIYGFGTDAFNKLFSTALTASAEMNLTFDFAFGANQGAGVPSPVETLGLAKELVYGNTTIQSGATFSGKVPDPIVDFNRVAGFMNSPEL